MSERRCTWCGAVLEGAELDHTICRACYCKASGHEDYLPAPTQSGGGGGLPGRGYVKRWYGYRVH